MSPASQHRPKDTWDGRIYGLKTIGHGESGIVLEIDRNLVVKISTGHPNSLQDINTERRIYNILSRHQQCPNIVKCHDYTHSRGIILERLEGTVRRRVNPHWNGEWRPIVTSQLPVTALLPVASQLTALRWTLDAATGLAFIHSIGIIQGDVGCHNMLLDRKGTLKLCDFSGSSIPGLEATVGYETRSQAPFEGDQPTQNTDRFALGSAMFEICVGRAPYYDLPDYEVAQRYQLLDYPIIPEHVNSDLAAIIQKCWQEGYSNTDAIVTDIGNVITQFEISSGNRMAAQGQKSNKGRRKSNDQMSAKRNTGGQRRTQKSSSRSSWKKIFCF